MKLNLGCGPHSLVPDWVNIDIDVPNDPIATYFKWDLSKGLPEHKSSDIEVIFSEHFIEHIERSEALKLLRDCYRVLKPGGVMRVSTPDLEKLCQNYVGHRVVKIPGVWEPADRCAMVNEGMRWWGHKWLYDQIDLVNLFATAGFNEIKRVKWHEGFYTRATDKLEVRPDLGEDLILEARK